MLSFRQATPNKTKTNIIDRLRYLLHIVQAPIYVQYFTVILLRIFTFFSISQQCLFVKRKPKNIPKNITNKLT